MHSLGDFQTVRYRKSLNNIFVLCIITLTYLYKFSQKLYLASFDNIFTTDERYFLRYLILTTTDLKEHVAVVLCYITMVSYYKKKRTVV